MVERDLVVIKEQYEQNKDKVLEQLMQNVVNVKLEVPQVVKQEFAVQSAEDLFESD